MSRAVANTLLPAKRPASTIARPRPRELPVTNHTCAIQSSYLGSPSYFETARAAGKYCTARNYDSASYRTTGKPEVNFPIADKPSLIFLWAWEETSHADGVAVSRLSASLQRYQRIAEPKRNRSRMRSRPKAIACSLVRKWTSRSGNRTTMPSLGLRKLFEQQQRGFGLTSHSSKQV